MLAALFMIVCPEAYFTSSPKAPPTERIPGVIYVDATEASRLHFVHHNSATTKKYLIEAMGAGVAIFDYDGDGWPDIFFVNGAKLKDPQPDAEYLDKSSPAFSNRLFRNNRDGTFTDVTEGQAWGELVTEWGWL
jgi:hypothetical protein